MAQSINLNPVSFITIGTIGSPGQRTFYLQASQKRTVVSLVIEKEHAQALAMAVDELLEELDKEYPRQEEILDVDMGLLLPVEPQFRVGRLGLGYDEEEDRLIVAAQELIPEEEEGKTPSVARFWATRAQMRALSRRAKEVVAAGRPLCILCHRPLDPRGHFCPKRNGDRRAEHDYV
ncbi:MAG: DUF3090 domain-containing protein [Anaerolineae bacterium]